MDKILIVEDEEEIAWGLSSVLKNQGYAAVFWDGRGSVRDIIEETGPDLILLDINLPGQDGFALVQGDQNRVFTSCDLPYRPQHFHG